MVTASASYLGTHPMQHTNLPSRRKPLYFRNIEQRASSGGVEYTYNDVHIYIYVSFSLPLLRKLLEFRLQRKVSEFSVASGNVRDNFAGSRVSMDL